MKEKYALYIEPKDGRVEVITHHECSRSPAKRPETLVGKIFTYSVLGADDDRTLRLSGLMYEEALYKDIEDSFRAKRRNVYPAQLVNTTENFAFYRIMQGVAAALNKNDILNWFEFILVLCKALSSGS